MKDIKIKTKSSRETKKIGEIIGKALLSKNKKINLIALEGDLGGGKTVFAKGLAKGLGVKEKIKSPTFFIYKKYKAKKGRFFYHFDAYRIKKGDVISLGIKNIISDKNNIILIEWSENIGAVLPKEKLIVCFSFISPKERLLIIKNGSDIIKYALNSIL